MMLRLRIHSRCYLRAKVTSKLQIKSNFVQVSDIYLYCTLLNQTEYNCDKALLELVHLRKRKARRAAANAMCSSLE